jgi:hypothetical protein
MRVERGELGLLGCPNLRDVARAAVLGMNGGGAQLREGLLFRSSAFLDAQVCSERLRAKTLLDLRQAGAAPAVPASVCRQVSVPMVDR